MGPLLNPVTWYRINYAGTQVMQWDFQNKGKSGWTGKSSFVEVEVNITTFTDTKVNNCFSIYHTS